MQVSKRPPLEFLIFIIVPSVEECFLFRCMPSHNPFHKLARLALNGDGMGYRGLELFLPTCEETCGLP